MNHALVLLAAFTLQAPLLAQSTLVVPEIERAALSDLFDSTGGSSWERKDRWKSQDSPCEWVGVWCEPTYENADKATTAHVVGLSLALNDLQGVLPSTFVNLSSLRTLDIRMNKLTGELPESILEKWDRNEFELFAWGNRFSNMVASAKLEVSASGVRCADDEDVRYFVELLEDGTAHFESIRCGRRGTDYVLVREGESPSLIRLARGLRRLGFDQLREQYSYPFTFTTHQTYVRTAIRFGDGRAKSIETYGGQGPIETWLVEQAVLGLVQQVKWQKEYRRKSGP